MTNYVPFSEEELGGKEYYEAFPMPYGTPGTRICKFRTPITPKENFRRLCSNEKPMWVPNYYMDFNFIQPLVMKDASARWSGGKDWFGIEWQYERLTNASMVKPGSRRLSDITKWEEELEFPDLSAIDWQKDFNENYQGKLSPDRPTNFVVVNGIFERTADLTSFEDAFCYLLEEPEALHAFYTKLTEWHIELFRIAREIYGADVITFHDDMGTQKSPFFSTETYREILLPHYKRMNDAAHEMGLFVVSHSCGCIERHMEAVIDAGFDGWEGQDNSNNKKMTMEVYGDRLFQSSNFVPVPGMTTEEAVQEAENLVRPLAPGGRLLLWVNTLDEKYFDAVSRQIYTMSRKMYCGAQ